MAKRKNLTPASPQSIVADVIAATAAADKEAAAQLAEKHRMEQEQADTLFRAEQHGRASKIAKALYNESTGGTMAALAVGDAIWEYFVPELLRGTPGDGKRFTDAVRHCKGDIRARLMTDTEPNVSRYLGFAAIARLWNRDKLATLPRSIVQEACPMITRDDSAPSLEYDVESSRGPVATIAYSWLPGCETAGVALLEKAAAAVGTCSAMTLQEFTAARKLFCASGKGRHNQGGAASGTATGKPVKVGKGGPKKAAAKLAQCVAAVKAYAAVADIPAAVRLKGLRAVIATVRELATELKAAATADATTAATVKPQPAMAAAAAMAAAVMATAAA